ncbi:MAG: hypothetical protein IKZ61_03175 [Prevotella sp.]|nr:hypothetical protein [Prevotella sp.]
MKYFYITLFLFILCVCSLNAQNLSTIVFVDKDGHQFADGSTIIVNTAEENDFGEMVLHSGLYVKNLTAGNAGVRVHFNVQTLDNGLFQICFPIACITKSETGVFETGSDLMTASEQRDLQTEWTPQTYGKCIVTYQIELMNQLPGFPPQFEPQEMGPQVTVVYEYADPAGINTSHTESQAEVFAVYSADGRQLVTPQHGLNIVHMSDGRFVKIYMK